MADVHPLWLERYASEPKGMRAGWLSVLGQCPVMPRDIVFPIPGSKKRFQHTVETVQQYFGTVAENAAKDALWVSWSPSNQMDVQGMSWVFGDIDSPDLEDSLVRARRYEEWCMAEFNTQPAVIFTAGKGFHLHMTHDHVDGLGTAYSDAFASLMQGAGASPDLGPLKHRRTYPRVPYCINLKATGIHRRPMYAIPVDLTWDLKEILDASAEIRITPFRVPHSDVLAGMLAPEVEKNLKAQERFRKTPMEVQQGRYENLVHAAIAFSESVGWKLVNKMGKPDGRRRVLSSLYIPALLIDSKGDKDLTMTTVQQWVDLSGGRWNDYKRFTEGSIKDCKLKDGTLRSPMGLRRFWMENGELQVRQSRTL